MIKHWFYASLRNSASSLSPSGCLHISSMGSSRTEICTGPLPLGGNLTAGSYTCRSCLCVMGFRIGVGDCLVMIDCCMIFCFLNCEHRASRPVELQGPCGGCFGKAGFPGKIPQRGEDDFPRNRFAARPCRPPMGIRQFCPVVQRVEDACSSRLSDVLILKRAALHRTALCLW